LTLAAPASPAPIDDRRDLRGRRSGSLLRALARQASARRRRCSRPTPVESYRAAF